MSTVQAYQGYFQNDGRFVADSPLVKLPIMRRVIVNILDDEVVKPPEANQKLIQINRILDDALIAEGDLTDDDWNELENIRKRTNSGMARVVSL